MHDQISERKNKRQKECTTSCTNKRKKERKIIYLTGDEHGTCVTLICHLLDVDAVVPNVNAKVAVSVPVAPTST